MLVPLHPLKKKHRGVEQLVARQAHNLEVARSNPASATNERENKKSADPDEVRAFLISVVPRPSCNNGSWPSDCTSLRRSKDEWPSRRYSRGYSTSG